MAYKIKRWAGGFTVSSRKGATINALSPFKGGVVRFDIYPLGLGGNRLAEFLRQQTIKLAEKLGTVPPNLEHVAASTSYAILSWEIGTCTVEQILVGLAELFDSDEFVKAIGQRS